MLTYSRNFRRVKPVLIAEATLWKKRANNAAVLILPGLRGSGFAPARAYTSQVEKEKREFARYVKLSLRDARTSFCGPLTAAIAAYSVQLKDAWARNTIAKISLKLGSAKRVLLTSLSVAGQTVPAPSAFVPQTAKKLRVSGAALLPRSFQRPIQPISRASLMAKEALCW